MLQTNKIAQIALMTLLFTVTAMADSRHECSEFSIEFDNFYDHDKINIRTSGNWSGFTKLLGKVGSSAIDGLGAAVKGDVGTAAKSIYHIGEIGYDHVNARLITDMKGEELRITAKKGQQSIDHISLNKYGNSDDFEDHDQKDGRWMHIAYQSSKGISLPIYDGTKPQGNRILNEYFIDHDGISGGKPALFYVREVDNCSILIGISELEFEDLHEIIISNIDLAEDLDIKIFEGGNKSQNAKYERKLSKGQSISIPAYIDNKLVKGISLNGQASSDDIITSSGAVYYYKSAENHQSPIYDAKNKNAYLVRDEDGVNDNKKIIKVEGIYKERNLYVRIGEK